MSVDLGRTGAVKAVGRNLARAVETAEMISAPSVPSGTAGGSLGTSYNYTTGGAASSLGHAVEYRFDWGDGSYSAWSSSASASHSWSAAGTYQVRAQARCGTHTGVVSGWSSAFSVTANVEMISTPSVPSGPAGGQPGTSYSYTTGSAASSLGHAVEYRFDWGDGSYSAWSSSASASHSWATAGTYQVRAQARCGTHTGAVSGWSSALAVGMFSTANMVLIPAGSFNMGSNRYASEQPIHSVYLDAYYMDVTEVTFDQYDAFCVATSRTLPSDSRYGRGTRPVINITWYDAKAYCEWVGKRLPTEAEWERACRAGTDTAYYWGDNAALAGSYAWYYDNSGGMTHPVGGKTPNALGLYDMSGNVWEWVADWYGDTYYSVSPGSNPPGPASGTYKVLRGGSWGYDTNDLRSAFRAYHVVPGGWYYDFGCRCARTP